MPEIIDPVFAKTSQNARSLLGENERFGLVFVKTGSINSGTVNVKPEKKGSKSTVVFIFLCFEYNVVWFGGPKPLLILSTKHGLRIWPLVLPHLIFRRLRPARQEVVVKGHDRHCETLNRHVQHPEQSSFKLYNYKN